MSFWCPSHPPSLSARPDRIGPDRPSSPHRRTRARQGRPRVPTCQTRMGRPIQAARPDPGLVLAHTLLSYHSSVVKVPARRPPNQVNDPVRTGHPGKPQESHSPRRVDILPHSLAPVKSDYRCFSQLSEPPTQDFRPLGSGQLPIQRPEGTSPPRRTQDPSLPHPIAPVKSNPACFSSHPSASLNAPRRPDDDIPACQKQTDQVRPGYSSCLALLS